MRVAFLTFEFVTERNFDGGLANHLDRLTRALAAQGHESEVFVTSEEGGIFRHGQVLVHRVHMPARGIWSTFLRRYPALQDLPLPMVKFAVDTAYSLDRAFRKRSAEVAFDVVQAAQCWATGLFATRQPAVPVVTRLSTYAPWWTEAWGWPSTLDQRLANRLESVAMRLGAGCYAPSRLVADAVATHESIPVQVIEPPFVPLSTALDPSEMVKLRSHEPYLLYFGQMTRVKGTGVLSEALPALFGTLPDLNVVLVGARADAAGQRLIGLAQEYPERVRYLGALPAAQLQPIVGRAAVVVLPSLLENLPNTCLEAMAAGRVVIGTLGASFEQLIDEGRSGFLVPPSDAQALQSAIAHAWTMDQSERTQMGIAARARIALLSPDLAIPKLVDFYGTTIARHELVRRRWAVRGRDSRFAAACLGCVLTELAPVLREQQAARGVAVHHRDGTAERVVDLEAELEAARALLDEAREGLRLREDELGMARDLISRIERGKMMRLMNALQHR